MSPTFIQLNPNLWVGQSRLFYTNHGIFISEGQACLVDPGIYPDEIEAIARFVAERGAITQTIILTHSHWDHILGPEHFPGVSIIAQASYLTSIREGKDAILKSIVAWQKENSIQPSQPFIIPHPTESFEDSIALALGNLELRLTHAQGHAPDQLTVYQASSATLWAADMLSDLEIPFASHNLDAYQCTLASLAEWEIRTLVPGHGHATTDPQEIRNRLSEDIAYLSDLRSNVENAIRQGKTLEETVAACSDMTYRNRAENEAPNRWNIESAYVELGGTTDKPRVGWEQEWEQ
jgi:glyoxylase-like metal-dependent hydrolase (beta-lactamase superfamily II)